MHSAKEIKMKQLVFFLFVLLVSITGAQPAINAIKFEASSEYIHPIFHYTLRIPDSWKINSNLDSETLEISNLDFPVTISILAYEGSADVTANEIAYLRGGAVWDGWNIVGAKQGDKKACTYAHVKEKFSQVFSKVTLKDDLTEESLMGVEDIIIKQPMIYVLTTTLSKQYWPLIVNELKAIYNSFYLQEP